MDQGVAQIVGQRNRARCRGHCSERDGAERSGSAGASFMPLTANKTMVRMLRVQRERMQPKPDQDFRHLKHVVAQWRDTRKTMMAELGGDVNMFDLRRMAALLEEDHHLRAPKGCSIKEVVAIRRNRKTKSSPLSGFVHARLLFLYEFEVICRLFSVSTLRHH